jgi:hypothetical protein
VHSQHDHDLRAVANAAFGSVFRVFFPALKQHDYGFLIGRPSSRQFGGPFRIVLLMAKASDHIDTDVAGESHVVLCSVGAYISAMQDVVAIDCTVLISPV